MSLTMRVIPLLFFISIRTSEHLISISWKYRRHRPRQQHIHLQSWRHILGAIIGSPDLDHDPGHWILLLWLSAAKKCTVHDLPQHPNIHGCDLAMVLLGILSRV